MRSDGLCDYVTVELSLDNTLTVRQITSCDDPLGVTLASYPINISGDSLYNLSVAFSGDQMDIIVDGGNNLESWSLSTATFNIQPYGHYGPWARGEVQAVFLNLQIDFPFSSYHQLRYRFDEDFPIPTYCEVDECFSAQINEDSVTLTPLCEDENPAYIKCTGFEAPNPGSYEATFEFTPQPGDPFILAQPPTIIYVE